MDKKKALVLFSGGQDSTTCLAWALSRYDYVETIGFDYGQRHSVELEVRPKILSMMKDFQQWTKKLGVDHIVPLPVIKEISESALTSETEIAMHKNGLPNTFVPGRNILFLTVAAMLAYRRGLGVIVGGMCETDFSGYPDCRNDTLVTLNNALNLGMDADFELETPLMWKNKAQAWKFAEEIGSGKLVELIRMQTRTCYIGNETQNEWGYGCGECPACVLRERGYREYKKL